MDLTGSPPNFDQLVGDMVYRAHVLAQIRCRILRTLLESLSPFCPCGQPPLHLVVACAGDTLYSAG